MLKTLDIVIDISQTHLAGALPQVDLHGPGGGGEEVAHSVRGHGRGGGGHLLVLGRGGVGASLAGSPGALSIYHVILDPFHFAAALAALAPAAKGSLSLRHGSPSPLVILDAKTRAYAEY